MAAEKCLIVTASVLFQLKRGIMIQADSKPSLFLHSQMGFQVHLMSCVPWERAKDAQKFMEQT